MTSGFISPQLNIDLIIEAATMTWHQGKWIKHHVLQTEYEREKTLIEFCFAGRKQKDTRCSLEPSTNYFVLQTK